MNHRFIRYLVCSLVLISSSHIFSLSATEAISQIQQRVQKERLLEETKDTILQWQSQPVGMNRTRMMNMLQEMIEFNAARQRPLQPALEYIVRNKKQLNEITDPVLETVLEAYIWERYVRYVSTRTYEEQVRNQRHADAIAALPQDVDVPAPRTSDTYQAIVVDISDQRIYAFEENILVATSPITSGKKWFGTVKWDFDVKKKQMSRILTSPFKNKNIQYRLHVDYWIQFYKWFGIHDACNSKSCWRKEFGWSDYVTRGSHGCVNTPYEFMSWIYDWVLPKTRVSVIQ